MRDTMINTFLIVLGIGSAFLGLKGFLVPNGLIDGGITGFAMLCAIWGWSLPVALILANSPFIIWGSYRLGTRFGINCCFSVGGLALCLLLFKIPAITADPLLTAVFGGFFLGAGMGLAIRGGAVLDGTEILALLLERKSFLSLGDIILVINIILFGVAAFFLGIEPALYSVLAYWSAAKTADFVLSGIEEYNGVMIISEQSDKIRQMIFDEFQRGVTIFRGLGGFHKQELEILFCVITRLELPRLRSRILQLDKDAFIVGHHINDAQGGLTQRVLVHKLAA